MLQWGAMMKLLCTPTSPYARKVRIVLIEKNTTCETVTASPWEDAPAVVAANPLRKVPVLITEHGDLVDSRVICDYLDTLTPTPRLLPQETVARAQMSSQTAMADGAVDAGAALLTAGRVAAEMSNHAGWQNWHTAKITNTLKHFEANIGNPPAAADAPTMLDIALGCLLAFLPRVEALSLPQSFCVNSDYPKLASWRDTINQRASFIQTAPPSQ